MPSSLKDSYDYIIIGAGPAGLQLAYFLEQRGRDYIVLERSDQVASFFGKYPRNRGLISFNKVHTIYEDPELKLRWDWNSLLTHHYDFQFQQYSKRLYPSADAMVRYLDGFASHFNLKIQTNTVVQQISKRADQHFYLQLQDDTVLKTRCCIVATGLSRPHIPDIPGIEHAEGYETVDFSEEAFIGQRLLIIGKGNSGFEVADQALESASLIHLASPDPIQMAWETRHPGHLRAQYTQLLDTYQLKLLNGTLDCHINQIRKQGDQFVVRVSYVHADGEEEELVYDRIIRATGFCFDTSLFDQSCKPRLVNSDRFPEMTATWESTATPNLFFAGTLMQVRDFKTSSSAFVDGFRYNIRTLFHLLEQRFHRVELPGLDHIDTDKDTLADAVLDRICQTSSLWTQFGYLCDVITVNRAGTRARYLFDLPVEFVQDSPLGESEDYYTITFEWGDWEGDVFAITRHPRSDMAYTNAFLHPIVRHYSKGELLAEHHVLEDLLGMYRAEGETGTVLSRSGRDMETYHREEHDVPLRAFFEKEFSRLHPVTSLGQVVEQKNTGVFKEKETVLDKVFKLWKPLLKGLSII